MTWVILAISAYFIWSITNIIDKVLVSKYIKDYLNLNFLALLLGSILIFIYIIITQGFTTVPWIVLFWSLIAGLTRVISYAYYYKALSTEEASRITILWLTSPIFTLVMAYFLINETLNAYGILAFVILLLGGLTASVKFREKNLRLSSAFWNMLIASFMIAANAVIMKYIFSIEQFWPAMLWLTIGEITGVILTVMILKKDIWQVFLHISNSGKLILAFDEILSGAGLIIYSIALSLGSASLISVLSVTNPIFVFLLALMATTLFPHILREQVDKKTILIKIAAIILMFIGTYFLQFNT